MFSPARRSRGLMEEGSIVHPVPKHGDTQHPEHDHDNVPRSKSRFYLDGLNRSRITRWRRNQRLHVFHIDVSAPTHQSQHVSFHLWGLSLRIFAMLAEINP